MAALQGKGYFIWKIPNCEGGSAAAIASVAQQAGLSHVLIKIADGTYSSNYDSATNTDYAPPVVAALRARGIQVWGWHYVYGDDPWGEADKAIQRVNALGLDGYVIDAEAEYKDPGKDVAASQFMARLRGGLPSLPIALSSYRYPTYHPALPYAKFLEKCDFSMPQVYWMQAHNPADQLIRSVREYQALTPYRPIIATGAAFREGGWQASANEVVDFLMTAQSLNLQAANFWSWDNCRAYLPDVWEAIKNYAWSFTPGQGDIAQQFVNALNTHDPNQVVALYTPTAVQVTADRTIQGMDNIRNYYTGLFAQLLPNATFRLTNFTGTGNARHLNWTAVTSLGNVNDGNDTFGLIGNKIAYHYSFFSLPHR